jgi:hypothetical protein
MEAARNRQYASPAQQASTSGDAVTPNPQPGAAGKTPYMGPPVSGSQIEGRSNYGKGKLGNIMKKMKEGPIMSKEGTTSHS